MSNNFRKMPSSNILSTERLTFTGSGMSKGFHIVYFLIVLDTEASHENPIVRNRSCKI
jgi:hypothetical protein